MYTHGGLNRLAQPLRFGEHMAGDLDGVRKPEPRRSWAGTRGSDVRQRGLCGPKHVGIDGELTSVKWKNRKVILRTAAGINEPIVKPQMPIVYDLINGMD